MNALRRLEQRDLTGGRTKPLLHPERRRAHLSGLAEVKR